MILRTPPQRKRRIESAADELFDEIHESPASDRRIVAVGGSSGALQALSTTDFDDVSGEGSQMVCTYNCRQMVKSEFMVALNKSEKQVVDYQSKLETLSSELHISEEERMKCKDRLLILEQELEASKGREKALSERLLKEVNDFNQRYHLQVKHCSELEVQLKKQTDLRKHAEMEARSSKDKALDLERKLQQVSEAAEREKIHLQKELYHFQDESKLSALRINANLEKLQMRAENSEKELELLKKQLVDAREQLSKCLHEKNELEHKLQISTYSTKQESASEAQTLVKHLQEELRNYEAEILEARRLKALHINNDLLKERLLVEKENRERAEKELSKLQELQLNVQNLEAELMSWKSLLNVIPDVSCYDDIPKKFTILQKEAIESTMEVGRINDHLKELEVSLEAAELNRQHAERESAIAKKKAEDWAVEVKQLEVMLSSATRDRGNLRLSATSENKQADVQDLETSLIEKENTIIELENNLRTQREVIDRQHDELRLINEKLTMEARRVKYLERESDQLRSDISLLESKLGHGDYSTENTKVLRMVNTLAVDNEAKHTIEMLRAELQKTQAKLQAVEELKGHSAAGDIISSDIPERLAQLKAQIATLEKREERYKAVFADKISVFRRACCLLFGYKIVMDDQQRPNGIPVTRFTLNSIYSQTDDEKLEFDYESGNMNILVNDYSSQREIAQQVEIFIKKWNSIPAFTANLTMESFNRRTFS